VEQPDDQVRPWGDDRERIEDWSRRNLLGGLEVKSRTPIRAPEDAHVIVTIAATGDLKGWITNTVLYPRRRGAGLAHLAPVIADLRAGDPGLVLLDAGDIVHGALSGILPRRASQGSTENPGSREEPGSTEKTNAGTSAFPILKLMNALRYDAAALGNFDMSLGWKALGAAMGKSDFPWLSANLERTGGDTGGGTVLPPYRVMERNGVRIGILGMTTPRVAAYLAPRHLKNVAFSGMEATARRWVDLVIGLFHSGLDDAYDREPILRGKVRIGGGAGKISDTGLGFDLIVSGDAHRLSPRRSTAALGAYAVPVLEPGARGNGLAVATIELSVQGGRWRVNRIARHTLSAERLPDPAAMARVSGEMKTIAAHLGALQGAHPQGAPPRRILPLRRCAFPSGRAFFRECRSRCALFTAAHALAVRKASVGKSAVEKAENQGPQKKGAQKATCQKAGCQKKIEKKELQRAEHDKYGAR